MENISIIAKYDLLLDMYCNKYDIEKATILDNIGITEISELPEWAYGLINLSITEGRNWFKSFISTTAYKDNKGNNIAIERELSNYFKRRNFELCPKCNFKLFLYDYIDEDVEDTYVDGRNILLQQQEVKTHYVCYKCGYEEMV